MIVTHQNPDFDAIASVWLLKRYDKMDTAPVKYVNTGNPDKEILENALAVVDTGKVFDPANLRFDHHQLPGQAANDTCAAKLVYEHVLKIGIDASHLEPLIDLIFCGDTGRSGADFSRDLGIHALLSGYKVWFAETNNVRFAPDEAIMAWGFGLLDALDTRLKNQARIKAELSSKVVYKSADNLVWGIRFGSSGSSFAAFELGARLVVFEGEPVEVEGGTTYPVGIMRAGEWNEPHTGELSQTLMDASDDQDVIEELGRWFRHPAGFFSGRGTPKAPVFEPVTVDLVNLAALFDETWER